MHGTYIYGIHTVQRLLKTAPEKIHTLYMQQERKTDPRMQALIALAHSAGVALEITPRLTLDQQMPNTQHQGVVAHCEPTLEHNKGSLAQLLDHLQAPAFLLVLDGVQDPHNLGACLRSACAAGVHAVIAPKHHAASITPTVRKIACGAAEIIPFLQVTNVAQTLRRLQQRGIWIFGAAEQGTESLYRTDLTGPMAWVLGAEGKGLRPLTRKHCDHLVCIPTQGAMETLNISVATGVCLFEALRQRLTT